MPLLSLNLLNSFFLKKINDIETFTYAEDTQIIVTGNNKSELEKNFTNAVKKLMHFTTKTVSLTILEKQRSCFFKQKEKSSPRFKL